MTRTCLVFTIAMTLLLVGAAASAAPAEQSLVLYSGRSKSLVDPLLKLFEKQSGIEVNVKYGKTAQLVLVIEEEGEHGRADVFWGQDAGGLGALAKSGYLASLPGDLTKRVMPMFRHSEGQWIATSGRARVLAYAPERVDEAALPKSVFELTGESWKGRVGWAPSNASFQSFVTAMRTLHGDTKTEQWLRDMIANGAKAYPKNTAIIEGIAAREVDLGLPNHYYLLRFKKSNSGYPVEQTFFVDGDVGNLVNTAGAAILETARNRKAAETFVRFLLSPVAQQYFASETFEYPLVDGTVPNPKLADHERLMQAAPNINLDDLDDLEGTLEMLREVGAL